LRWINVPGADLVLLSMSGPCNRQQKMQDITTKEDREPGHENAVLLLVDDDAAVLGSLKFCLEIDGFKVQLYASGEALLNEVALPLSGCLVLDYHLPDMTGLELLARLRSQGVALPALLITGHPGIPLRRHAAAAGVAIVDKPVLGNALTDAIRRALGAPTDGATT
jgi:FixJ family two-component response regulator